MLTEYLILAISFTSKICFLRYISNIIWVGNRETMVIYFVSMFLTKKPYCSVDKYCGKLCTTIVPSFSSAVVASGALLQKLQHFQQVFLDITSFALFPNIFVHRNGEIY